MKPTDPGQFRRLVTFERPQYIRDSSGQQIPSWIAVGPGRVAIRTLSSGETVRNALAQLEMSHELRLRYRPDLQASWRVILQDAGGDRVLEIAAVTNVDEANVELVLRCVERGPRQ